MTTRETVTWLHGLLVAGALCGGAADGTQAQDAATVLARAQRAYRETRTLTASFTQTISNPMLGAPVTAHGTLVLAPPDRFAMRFADPEGDAIVADGTWLWAYTPSSVPDQVLQQAIPEDGPASPNLMGQFVDRPLERYTAEYLGTDTVRGAAVDVVRLTPVAAGLPFRVAEIAVDRTDGILRRMTVTEQSGQHRTLVFDRIVRNGALPPDALRFRVPAGVRIVRLP